MKNKIKIIKFLAEELIIYSESENGFNIKSFVNSSVLLRLVKFVNKTGKYTIYFNGKYLRIRKTDSI